MVKEENIIKLIKKCLALAGSPNEHEAARAMEKAQELLEKYNLSMADVKQDEIEIIIRLYDVLGRFLWRKNLVIAIAEGNFCRAFTFFGRHMRDKVDVVGRAVNVEATFEMANWILPQMERLSRLATRKYTPEYDVWTDKLVSKQSYRDSFCNGMVGQIRARLYEERQHRMEVSANTKALVVDRRAEVNDWVEDHMTLGKASPAKGPRSFKGFGDGGKAGDNIALRKPKKIKGGN